jgi:hypothetical protein
MSVLTFLSLSPAVPGSCPANGERGWSVTEASLAVLGSERGKEGEGIGAHFPPHSLVSLSLLQLSLGDMWQQERR